MNSIIKPVSTDYNTSLHILEDLTKDFPFLNAEIQGRSALGRGIFSFSIGNMKKTSLIVGGFHGTDQISSLLIMLFTERLCRCVKYGTEMCAADVRRALSQGGITLIPCINPDGREIAVKGFESAKNLRTYLSDISPEGHSQWRSNAFGVNINKNFSRGWSDCRHQEYETHSAVPSASGYCGEHAESEAETKVLTRLCRMRGFTRCMSLSAGRNELCRHVGEGTPAVGAMMGKILADSASCIYREGVGNASFCRWFGEEFSRPAFTLSVGTSSPEELYGTYERIEEALLLFLLM